MDNQEHLLKTDTFIHKNYKRYFNAWEFLNGFHIINLIGISKNERRMQMICDIFHKVNNQHDDRQYDFKFIKDLTTPVFAMTLLERAFTSDTNFTRMQTSRTLGILQDGKDIIGTNMDLQSIV